MFKIKKNSYWMIMASIQGLAFIPSKIAFAVTLDGSGEFDALLLAILDILNGPILIFALIFSVVAFGVSIALFPHKRETIERGAMIVLGLLIATKGSAFVAGVLGVGFLV